MREPPAGLVQALNDSQATLEATLAAGEGWKVRLKERAGALVVTSRAGPKSGPVIVRGALRVSLPAVGADGEADSELARRVFEEYVLYERRVVWDAGIASQTQIRAYADGQHSVNAYEVHGAAGGLVQARYFVEARRTLCAEGQSPPYTNVCVDWTLDDAEAMATLPKGGKKHIRGRNLPGSGLVMRRADGRTDGRATFEISMVGCSDLGGWLPASVTDRATYGAYRDILLGGVEALKGVGVDVRLEPAPGA